MNSSGQNAKKYYFSFSFQLLCMVDLVLLCTALYFINVNYYKLNIETKQDNVNYV